MPWFWPWKGDGSSTASFERTLSSLSHKITDTQSELDATRSHARRLKVLTTLYLSFAYLVYAIVLVLVVGYRNIGAFEWTGVAGGPMLIYAIGAVLSAYYNFRIETLTSRLKGFQVERAKTIQKLKDATKYDSTLELLEKYGGSEARPVSRHKDATSEDNGSPEGEQDRQSQGGGDDKAGARSAMRTTMPPPPTANIPVRDGPLLPQQPAHGHSLQAPPRPVPQSSTPLDASEEFAPNAFSPDSPVAQPSVHYDVPRSSPSWYDRILDLLLGEDETAPKNRIVLICKACRLVNGQAPPGTKSLAELGMWKCMACRTPNGEVDEGTKIMREVLGTRQDRTGKAMAESDNASGSKGSTDDSDSLVEVKAKGDETLDAVSILVPAEEDSTPAKAPKRRKGKGRK